MTEQTVLTYNIELDDVTDRDLVTYLAQLELGYQHHTGIENEYLLNGKIYQTRKKFGETRNVSFPVSKNKLNELGFPNGFKLELSK